MEIAIAAARATGLKKEHIFLLEGRTAGYKSVADLIEMGKSFGESGQVPAYQLPRGKTNGQLCGYLSFSSQTTGLLKAVSKCFSHRDRKEDW